MKMATGSNIRTLRNLAGLTLEQLSELSGVEPGSEVAALPLQLFGAGFIGKISHGDTQRRLSTSFGPVHVVSKATADGLVSGFSASNSAARSAIVFSKLPCDVAREVDSKVDDGSIATGHASSTACANGIVQWYAVAM